MTLCLRIDAFNNVHHLQPLQRIGRDGTLAAQHIHDIFIDKDVVGGGSFVGAVIVGRIAGRERRHGIPLDMAIGHFIHVLPCNLDRTLLANNGHAGLQVCVPNRCRIIQGPHPTLYKVELNHARIFKLNAVGMIEIIELHRGRGNISEQPIQDINEVTKLREQSASIQVFGAMPPSRMVVAVIAVPKTIHMHLIDRFRLRGPGLPLPSAIPKEENTGFASRQIHIFPFGAPREALFLRRGGSRPWVFQ